MRATVTAPSTMNTRTVAYSTSISSCPVPGRKMATKPLPGAFYLQHAEGNGFMPRGCGLHTIDTTILRNISKSTKKSCPRVHPAQETLCFGVRDIMAHGPCVPCIAAPPRAGGVPPRGRGGAFGGGRRRLRRRAIPLPGGRTGLPPEAVGAAVSACRRAGARLHAAINAIPSSGELPAFLASLHRLRDAGVDEAILNDPGVIALVRREIPRWPLCASVGLSVLNPEDARAYRDLGVDAVVLPSAVRPGEIPLIKKASGLRIEVFAYCRPEFLLHGKCGLTGYVVEGNGRGTASAKREGAAASSAGTCRYRQHPTPSRTNCRSGSPRGGRLQDRGEGAFPAGGGGAGHPLPEEDGRCTSGRIRCC